MKIRVILCHELVDWFRSWGSMRPQDQAELHRLPQFQMKMPVTISVFRSKFGAEQADMWMDKQQQQYAMTQPKLQRLTSEEALFHGAEG